MNESEVLQRELKCVAAYKSLYAYCYINAPDFYDAEYLKEICDAIQEFENDDNEFLIINCPPRCGKSRTATLATQWLLGRNPHYKIMTCSYNEKLSSKFSKQVRNSIAQGHSLDKSKIVFSDVFPDVKIKHGSATVSNWGLEGNDEDNYMATSPNGSATGSGADFIIIDDLIKNKYEASNADILENHFEWFSDTIYSRLEGKRKIIVIMTRWAPILNETPVLTTKGWKNHGDLQVGDYVFGDDGKPVMVKGVTEPVWCDMVVKTRTENILCSSNHLWAVKTRPEYNNQIFTTKQLTELKSQRKIQPIKPLEYSNSNKIKLPIDPYWLGLWLGDGCKEKPVIRCGKHYNTHCRSTVYNYTVSENHGDYFYSYTHQGIRKELIKLNLLCNKHIPEIYKKASVNDRLKLLAGLIDSDGDARVKSGVYRFANTNTVLLQDVRDLVHSLGFVAGFNEVVNKKGSIAIDGYIRNYDCYRFSFTPTLEVPVKLDYKKIKPRKPKHRLILGVEKSDVQGWGKCISTTARDGLYLVGKSLIPTHNTNDIAGKLIRMCNEQGRKYRLISKKAFDGEKMLNEKVMNYQEYQNLIRTIGEDIVRANYDQEPIDLKGVLYEHLVTYTQKPNFVRIEAVCDTADTGSDYLCSIVYGKTDDRMAYILDVIYTKESMETTENKVAKQFTDYNVSIAHIESNNGGRGFARSVERICRTELNNRVTVFKPYTQTLNKQSRILSNATAVELNVRFPQDWKQLYPEFYKSVTEYQREGKNAHDDAEDALTSIVEKTVLRGGLKFS